MLVLSKRVEGGFFGLCHSDHLRGSRWHSNYNTYLLLLSILTNMAVLVTDRQIDALVYERYGLTEEEIKIMEKA